MHSHVETKRTLVQSMNVQCHHSSPNDTLEIELPEYGTINSIRLMMHLTEGVGEASFKQDIEDLIQIVKAQNLHAGQRSKPHILYWLQQTPAEEGPVVHRGDKKSGGNLSALRESAKEDRVHSQPRQETGSPWYDSNWKNIKWNLKRCHIRTKDNNQ